MISSPSPLVSQVYSNVKISQFCFLSFVTDAEHCSQVLLIKVFPVSAPTWANSTTIIKTLMVSYTWLIAEKTFLALKQWTCSVPSVHRSPNLFPTQIIRVELDKTALSCFNLGLFNHTFMFSFSLEIGSWISKATACNLCHRLWICCCEFVCLLDSRAHYSDRSCISKGANYTIQ